MLTYHLEQRSNRRKSATASLVFFQSLVGSLTQEPMIFFQDYIYRFPPGFELQLKLNSRKFACPARRLPEVAAR